MRKGNVEIAASAARQFLERAHLALAHGMDSPKYTGALRRASMELTRALAEMRKP
jgi:hypothetical protein